MSIDFRWDDDAQTVIRYVADGAWNWNDLHKHMRRSTLAFDRLAHPVEAILDLTRGSGFPAGAVAHLRSLGKSTHPNRTPRLVIIGVPAAIQTQLGAANGEYRARDQHIRFVETDAEAAQVIAAWQADDASSPYA